MEYLQSPSLPLFINLIDSLVQLLPLVLEGQLPVDHDIDLPGPGLYGHPDFLQPRVKAVLTTWESGGYRSYRDVLRLVPGAYSANY